MNKSVRRTRADFELVVLPHLGAAYNLARWIVRNQQDAEDAVQDACLRALQGFDGYAGGNGKAWLLAIVRNVCLTRLHRVASDKIIRLDDAMVQIEQQAADHTLQPDVQLIAKLDRVRIRQAIARLPESFREAIVLRELEDLSYQDIASVVGVPVGTVMSRLARGRELLRTLLAGEKEGRRDEL